MHPRSMNAKSPQWPGRQGQGSWAQVTGLRPSLCLTGTRGTPAWLTGQHPFCRWWQGDTRRPESQGGRCTSPAWALGRQRAQVSGNLSRGMLLPSLPGNLPAGQPERAGGLKPEPFARIGDFSRDGEMDILLYLVSADSCPHRLYERKKNCYIPGK